jgi:hypothetical protein
MSNRRAQDERIEGTPDGVNAITEIVDVPDAPTIGTATAGLGSVSVAFTPATTGGTVSTFTATSTPGTVTGTSATSPITVSGLSGGTSYTFTVTPSNSTGTGPSSSASNSVSPADLVSSYDALYSTAVPAGGVSSVTFSNIPNGYENLQLRYISRGSISASFTNVNIRFNDDTGNNYRTHWLDGNGSSALGEDSGTTNLLYLGVGTGSTANAGVFGTGVFDFLDYSSPLNYKTCRSLAGEDNNGSGFVALISGFWMSNAPITKITVFPNSGTLNEYSEFSLYGVK